MHRILPLILLGLSLTPAHAAVRDDLPALVAAFVAEERPDADQARQAAISECIISAFEGIGDEELATMIVVDDFEESFDNLLEAYPEREEIVETCEDM